MAKERVKNDCSREQRKTEFLEAAERLFKEKGIIKTSVNTIVKELDVAKGLFYYYFKSKDEVIDAVLEKYSNMFEEHLATACCEDGTYEERLECFIITMIESFGKVKLKFGVSREDSDMAILSNRILKEEKSYASNKLCLLLEEGNRLGVIDVQYPTYLADMIVSGVSDFSAIPNVNVEHVKDMILQSILSSRKEGQDGRI